MLADPDLSPGSTHPAPRGPSHLWSSRSDWNSQPRRARDASTASSSPQGISDAERKKVPGPVGDTGEPEGLAMLKQISTTRVRRKKNTFPRGNGRPSLFARSNYSLLQLPTNTPANS